MTKMCEKVADPFKIVIWKVGNLHYSSLPRDLANVVFTLAAPQVQNQHHSNYQNCQLCDKSIDHQVRRHYLLCLLQNYLITLTNTLEVQIPTNLKSWNTNTWIFTSPNQDMYLNTRPDQLKKCTWIPAQLKKCTWIPADQLNSRYEKILELQLLGVGWERLGIDFNQFSEMFFQVSLNIGSYVIIYWPPTLTSLL